MRVTRRLAYALLLICGGCASPPIFVKLDVSGPPTAQATVRELSGTTDPAPHECTTPCRLEFAPDGVYEIELEADGYYPARVAAEYHMLFQYQRGHDVEEPPLVIPLLPRP